MPPGRPHVVIIGGGSGCLSAARALARAPVRVTPVDDVTCQRSARVFTAPCASGHPKE